MESPKDACCDSTVGLITLLNYVNIVIIWVY